MEQEKSAGILPKSEMYYDINAFIREYDGKTPVVLFGTNHYAEFILEKLIAAGIRVDCFTCNTKARYGSKYCNIDVREPSSVFRRNVFIIISIIDAYTKRDILNQLLEAGVKREQIIIPIEPFGLFQHKKLQEVPEFAEAEKWVTLTRIQNDREYFCSYFVTNELMRIVMLEKNEFSQIAEELLSDTGVEIQYIDPDDRLDGFDAILLTDRENFIFLEEQLMNRMGEIQIPIIDFWAVGRQS